MLTLLALLCGCTGQPEAPDPERPNFVIIDIDSLRADRIGLERNGQPVAPVLTELARRGITFDAAVSQSNWTIPSLLSLLTGRYPQLTSDPTRGRGQDLQPVVKADIPTLPEILGVYGYQRRVAWGQTTPRSFPVYSRGFDATGGPDSGQDLGTIHDATTWLATAPADPFLLLVHDRDLHSVRPPLSSERLHRYVPDHPACEPLPLHELMARLEPELGREAALAHVIGHYDAALAEYDAAVGQLLTVLEDTGRLERTVLVVISDHGEELGEHGGVEHAVGSWETLLQVPLIIVDPQREGRRVAATAQTIDLGPTLLARAGIPVEARMHGRSLLPVIDGAPQEARALFAMAGPGSGALREGDLKLALESARVAQEAGDQSTDRCVRRQQRLRLFDLSTDPDELHDICSEFPAERDALRQKLLSWLKYREGEPQELAVLPEADERMMRRQGYWSSEDRPETKSPPRPADH